MRGNPEENKHDLNNVLVTILSLTALIQKRTHFCATSAISYYRRVIQHKLPYCMSSELRLITLL